MQKNIWIAAKYLRLSIVDGDKAESESIVNQSILIDNYICLLYTSDAADE